MRMNRSGRGIEESAGGVGSGVVIGDAEGALPRALLVRVSVNLREFGVRVGTDYVARVAGLGFLSDMYPGLQSSPGATLRRPFWG